MTWVDMVAILSGLGGLEFIKWLFERKQNKRRDEFQLLKEMCIFLEQQITEKEQRFAEQTDLVRELNRAGIEAERTIAGLRLEIERKRCDRLDCGKRKPPNAFTPILPEPETEKSLPAN